jgi:hypothetical protein
VPTYDSGDSSSGSSGGGTDPPEEVANGGSGGTNTGTTDDSNSNQPDNGDTGQQNSGGSQSGVEERLDELLSEMEASSEQAAVVPMPIGGSNGLTAKGAIAGVGGLALLYLAFTGAS